MIMTRRLACIALLGGLVAAARQSRSRSGGAQPGSQPVQLDEKTRIILDVTRVNILFTVTDRKGRFITNLTKDDFEVFEDNRPQKILEFTAETDLPLRIALLLDTSNSVRPRFRFIQEAAIEFLNSVMRPRYDKALVVSFDTNVELVADLTDDPQRLASAIRELRPGGGTSMYDAIYFACRDKLAQEQPRHKFRRALVVLSDGDDNQSRVTRDQALEMAQKADVVIYTISTNITRLDTEGDKVLRYFARETGGLALFPFKIEDLAQSFENIANELRHQYNIFYRPEPLRTDGRYQSVDVRVKGRRDLIVRARKGYYAPKL
ncbi:MAG: VWA domain-containing protein [Bryobacteraceae bacterium]